MNSSDQGYSSNNFESLGGKQAEGTGRFQATSLYISPPQYKSSLNYQEFQKPQQLSSQMKPIGGTESPIIGGMREESPPPQYNQQSQVNKGLMCPQHVNQEVTKFCTTLGCPYPNPWLCKICEQEHLCPHILKQNEFLEILQDKMQTQINWQQVDEDKFKIYNEIKLFFKQLQTDIAQEFQLIESFFLKKLLIENNQRIELKSSFVNSIFQTSFATLLEQPVTYNNHQADVARLIVNDFFSLDDLSRSFNLGKKLKEIKDEVKQLTNNFIQYLQETLEGDIRHHSDDKFKFHNEILTPIQTKLQAETIVNEAKVVQTLNKHRGTTIVDICQCSNTLLATASDNGQIIIWKLPLYSTVCEFQHGTECTSIAFCTDETKQRFLLSAGQDGEHQIYIWNLDLRRKVGEVIGHTYQLRKVVPLPRFRIVWCSQDTLIRIWNLKERREIGEIKAHSAWINDICKISRSTMASCSRDYTVCVSDFEQQKVKYVIKDSSYVTCLESINQELYAFGNYNGWVKIYQTESPQIVMSVQISSKWLDSNCLWYICKISEHLLAITGVDGYCTIFRIDDKKVLRKIQVNTQQKSEIVYYIKEQKQLVIADKLKLNIYQ